MLVNFFFICLMLKLNIYIILQQITNNFVIFLTDSLVIFLLIFFFGLSGILFNYRNFLITMLSVEIMYLGITVSFLIVGLIFSDQKAQIYALVLLIIAASESAVGLGLLVVLYKFGQSIDFKNYQTLKGFFFLFYSSDLTFWKIFPQYQQYEYFKIWVLFLLIFVISLLLFSIAYFLSLSTLKDSEKLSQYECGFDPFDEATRHPFDVHFYIVGILFLIFDIEVALLFPWVLGLKVAGWLGFFSMFIFLLILTIGFIYEWNRGALLWPQQQLQRQFLEKNIPSIFSFSLMKNNIRIQWKTNQLLSLNLSSRLRKKINFSLFSVCIINPLILEQNVMNDQKFDIFSFDLISLISFFPEIYLLSMILISLFLIAFYIPGLSLLDQKIIGQKLYSMSCWTLSITFIFYCCDLFFGDFQIFVSLFDSTVNDKWTILIKLFLLLTIIIILKVTEYSVNSFHPRILLEYPIFFLLLLLFLICLVSAYNFFILFICVIGFSLTLYVLLLRDSFNQNSREAGIKYFYLSTISSGLLICGIFFIYLLFQTTNFVSISWLLQNWSIINVNFEFNYIYISMLSFFLFGFFFKLAAFPCHLWAPEIYEGSPHTMTAIFVLPIKVAIFCVLLRILGHTFSDLYFFWHYILWMSAAFSMLWGCFGALIEPKIKRFLAYSSMNQMGFLLMGLTCGTFEGFRSSVIYLFIYVIMNLGFFLVYLSSLRTFNFNLHQTSIISINKLNNLSLNSERSSLTYLTDLNLLSQKHYIFSIFLVIILFSMAGIPPLGGFMIKYFIFLHSFETGHWGLIILGMFTSVIAAYYYLRLIKIMWFEKSLLLSKSSITILNVISLSLELVLILICFILIFFFFFLNLSFVQLNQVLILVLDPMNVAKMNFILCFFIPIFGKGRKRINKNNFVNNYLSLIFFSVINLNEILLGILSGIQEIFLFLSSFLWICLLFLSLTTILVSNPIYALLCLIGVFFFSALFLISINCQFLGYLYLIVYLGAISIIFLFVIMLFNLRNLQKTDVEISNFSFLRISFKFYFFLSIKFLLSLALDITNFIEFNTYVQYINNNNVHNLQFFLIYETQDIFNCSLLFYTQFSYLFILCSLILLTAMISSIVLALSTNELQFLHNFSIIKKKNDLFSKNK